MRLKVHNCFILLFPYNYYFVYIQLLFVVFKNVISFCIILYITQYLTKILIIKVLSVLLFSQMYYHVIVLHFTYYYFHKCIIML